MLTRVTWILVLLWKSEQIMPYSNLKQPDLTALDRKGELFYIEEIVSYLLLNKRSKLFVHKNALKVSSTLN